MTAERPSRRGQRGVGLAIVAWLAVLGGTVALGVAGRLPDDRAPTATGAASAAPLVTPSQRHAAEKPRRSPLPTRPPIGEDGIMGGLPFGTAWEWLRPD